MLTNHQNSTRRARPRPVAGAALMGAALLVAGAALLLPGAGSAAEAAPGPNGSVLLDETFTGDSVADPGFMPLDSACLTGAAGPPPAGASTTGPCTGEDQTTPHVPTPGVTPGWLQLTDGANYRVGGIVYNRQLPGNGGLQVEFKQYQYGGNGADGIGFFLVDGSYDLTKAGATGGSLGYAQRNLEPGVDGGYLGVGLDAYGNFANDAEQRGNECPDGQKSPVTSELPVTDTVTLRGPGNGITEYCFLDSTIKADNSAVGYTTTLPGSLRDSGTTPENAERTVRVTVSPDAKPLVTVEIDFQDGKGYQTVLSHQMTQEAPPTYKFGFSGSTGGLTDTHLIRGLHAASVNSLNQLNLVKTPDYPGGVAPGPLHPGDTVPYRFLVTNTGNTELTGVTVTDPEVQDIQCPRTTLGPMGTPTASMECTGTHVLTVADTYTGTFTNTATAHGTGTTGAIDSNESTASVPVEANPPHLEIGKTATPSTVEPGGRVSYTLTAKNTGTDPIAPADLTDDLAGVVDDAGYNGDVHATTGTATVSGSTLEWQGDLDPGQTVTITYSVTVTGPDYADGTLMNTATSSIPGTQCTTSDDGSLPCTTVVIVNMPTPTPTPTPTETGTPPPTPPTAAPPTGTPPGGGTGTTPPATTTPGHGHQGGLADTGTSPWVFAATGLACLCVAGGVLLWTAARRERH
jgi:uncharacterized repeat protein (TIGR01451 family)